MYSVSNLSSSRESVQAFEEIFQKIEDELIEVNPATVRSEDGQANINTEMFYEQMQQYFIRAFDDGVFSKLTEYQTLRELYLNSSYTIVSYLYGGNISAYIEEEESLTFAEVTSGGKFPKRFAKEWKKQVGWKLPEEVITNIGNIYNQCKITSKIFRVKFTNNFCWEDGDFGKEGSCWWGCYGNSRDTLYHYGGWAMLFFGERGQDIGRTWALPISDSAMFLFNSYGVQAKDAAAVMAKFLEETVGVSYIYGIRSFRNTGDYGDYPYINHIGENNNGNGSSGYLVYRRDEKDSFPKEEKIVRTLHRQWGIFTNDDNNELGSRDCDRCGENYDEDDLTYVDGEYYCESCYNDLFQHCNGCYEDVRHTTEVEGNHYCEDCLHNLLINGEIIQCHHCDEYVYSNNTTTAFDTGNTFCSRCATNVLERCELCGDWCESTSQFLHHSYCENCFEVAVKEYEENSVREQINELEVEHPEQPYAFELQPERYSSDREVLLRVMDIVETLTAETGRTSISRDEVIEEYRRRGYR